MGALFERSDTEGSSAHTSFLNEDTDLLRLYSNGKAHFTTILIKCLIMARKLLTSNLMGFTRIYDYNNALAKLESADSKKCVKYSGVG